ncbi:MAG: transaldolase [Candidatus Altiarchaeota archaeon]|nr:transaldolase [Candidatus Altiarchaeota archaeon]
MKIYIDSADLDEIKKAYEWGIADGVTTNPSLLKKAVGKRADINMKKYIIDILKTAEGTPVSLEVTTETSKEMIAEGKKLYELFNPVAGNVVIKIPVNPAYTDADKTHFDGIKTIKALSTEGIPVNTTLIFTPEQALLAAKAGARYVSPFAGRVDDLIRKNSGMSFGKDDYYPHDGKTKDGVVQDDTGVVSGIDLVSQCVDILRYYGLETEVLAASLRNPRQVRDAALVGADIATLPFPVIADMLKHKKTYEGMEAFKKDIVDEYARL